MVHGEMQFMTANICNIKTQCRKKGISLSLECLIPDPCTSNCCQRLLMMTWWLCNRLETSNRQRHHSGTNNTKNGDSSRMKTTAVMESLILSSSESFIYLFVFYFNLHFRHCFFQSSCFYPLTTRTILCRRLPSGHTKALSYIR
jgi:hypothetical protein